jgi:cytidine deaminase
MNTFVKDDATLRSRVFAAGRSAIKNSYSPYSNFKVAAVIISATNQIYKGCNIENASYASTVCAEVSAIAQMVSSGEQSIKQLYLFSNSEQFVMPCGGCRQCIREFCKNDISVFLVNSLNKVREHSLKELLPHAFSFEPEHQSE